MRCWKLMFTLKGEREKTTRAKIHTPKTNIEEDTTLFLCEKSKLHIIRLETLLAFRATLHRDAAQALMKLLLHAPDRFYS